MGSGLVGSRTPLAPKSDQKTKKKIDKNAIEKHSENDAKKVPKKLPKRPPKFDNLEQKWVLEAMYVRTAFRTRF